jgi:hypothetical protein
MSGLSRGNWSSTSNSNQSNHHRSEIHRTVNSTKTKPEIHEYDRICGVDPTKRQLVDGYTQLVIDRVNNGWSSHLLTFLFSQLPGTRSAAIQKMTDELHRVYSTLLTRVHRKPRTAPTDTLPILIGATDLPVYKRDRKSSPLVICNGGLHFHALLLVPPTTRLGLPVEEHLHANREMYAGEQRLIQRLDVRSVTHSYERVVDYVFKTILRGRVPYDDGVLILPKARRELA